MNSTHGNVEICGDSKYIHTWKFHIFSGKHVILIGISAAEDGMKNRIYDTLEECVLDIEELKDELAMIQMTQTASGRDRWDTPEIVVGAGKKSKMRKDRY